MLGPPDCPRLHSNSAGVNHDSVFYTALYVKRTDGFRQPLPLVRADQDDEERHPTKVVTTTASVEVKCAVSTFDYEGRTDGRSMRTIVSHVAPRQLVVVNGSPEVRALPYRFPTPSPPEGIDPHRGRQRECRI